MFIKSESLIQDLILIDVSKKQLCFDYVKDIDILFLVCTDDSSCGYFYIEKNFVDLISIDELLIILRKLIVFINKTGMEWSGNKFGGSLTEFVGEYFRIQKTKFILIFTNNSDELYRNEYMLI